MSPFDEIWREPSRFALFLDFDGTLVALAARPEAVVVPPELPAILSAAAARLGGALAIVSGRRITDLDQLLAPADFAASGAHGNEIRLAPGQTVMQLGADLTPAAGDALHRAIAGYPGAHLENKGITLAVHYRAEPGIAAALAEELARHVPPGLEIVHGDHVFELRPVDIDKGNSLHRFMAQPPFARRRPVFITDHEIDHAGFAAAAAFDGFGLSVGRLLDGAAGHFEGPAQLRAWLADAAA